MMVNGGKRRKEMEEVFRKKGVEKRGKKVRKRVRNLRRRLAGSGESCEQP